jgi:hypothetical protein
MNYGHSYGISGMDMLQTVYAQGVRIKIDTNRLDDEVLGSVVKYDDRKDYNPYDPTDEISFDWKGGFVKMSAPKALGFAGNVSSGSNLEWGEVKMSNITISNPEGIYDPIDPTQPWFAVSIYSVDNKPLSESNQVNISIGATSFNTGYAMGAYHEGKVAGTRGTLPVLVSRMGASFEIPQFSNAQFVMKDFNGDIIDQGTLDSRGRLILKKDQPVWYIEMTKTN